LNVSTEDIIAEEERAKQEARERGKASRASGASQTNITAFFKRQPQAETGDGATASQSEETTTAQLLADLSMSGVGGEQQVVAGVTPPFQPMKRFLRLGFLDRAAIDKMKKTPAREAISKGGMIGPVYVVQSSVGSEEFTVDKTKFGELNEISKRTAGKKVGRTKYVELKKALDAAGWCVHAKYLAERARDVGNIDWKPPLLEAVVEAVKKTQSKEGTPQFEKARMRLAAMNSEKTVLGKLTVEQVKYVWRRLKDKEEASAPKRGRPLILSAETTEAVMEYIDSQLDQQCDYKVEHYMAGMEKILEERNELDAFNRASRDPYRYLRDLIRQANGVPRTTTDGGSKGVPKEERLECTVDNFERLAYLVFKYNLTKSDVFNFDETAVRFHDDASGKVIARKGQKRVRGEKAVGSTTDQKLCCTFIPMVNFAGDKFDPALIFKGTAGQLRAIPGYKKGFQAYQSLYSPDDEGKLCFMQNTSKWSTNQTMQTWFIDHFIPEVKAAKQARRDKGEEVPDRYVVILDGVGSHCMGKNESASWITAVQNADEHLILLWLPPNMTGDLQPLDVNFNRPFKSRYKKILWKLRHPVDGADGADGAQLVGAKKVKDEVIQAIIQAYNSVPKEQITAGWTEAGKFVYEDNEKSAEALTYESAWDEKTQGNAALRHIRKELFHDDMKGGVSVVGGDEPLAFIPKPGRKKKRAPTAAPGPMAPTSGDSDASSSLLVDGGYSEYSDDDCPDEEDFIDSENEGDEIILSRRSTRRGGPVG
jgi:hypothetical protein